MQLHVYNIYTTIDQNNRFQSQKFHFCEQRIKRQSNVTKMFGLLKEHCLKSKTQRPHTCFARCHAQKCNAQCITRDLEGYFSPNLYVIIY